MLYPGLVVDNTYQVCDEIGSGGMGVIYLAVHLRLNKYVVMKRLKNAEADFSSLRNEVDVLKSLRHSYLPQVYDFIEHDSDLYAVIDYIEGRDLKYYIDNRIEVGESQLIKWLRQLCQVLEYMHRHQPRVLHMDIKPANIIIQPNGDICLIDFGISMLGNGRLRGISYEYSSPEQNYNASCVKQELYDELIELDERTDIYSLGATFYELITGLKPTCMIELESVGLHSQVPISEPFVKIIDKAVAYRRKDRFPDTTYMLKAIENMFKLSEKYKLYLLAQIASSALACVLIFLGAILIYNGSVEQVRASFEQDYNAYIAALNSNDTGTAIFQAKKLINTSDYQKMMDFDMLAEIYHSIGDCYFDEGDYLNASVCYERAVSFPDIGDKADIYYRDYALSLIGEQRVDEAREILSKLGEDYPDSPSCILISAQLAFQSGDYDEADTLASQALSSAFDEGNRYTAYMLLGDTAMHKNDLESAAQYYSSAMKERQTAQSMRRLGTVQLKLGAKENSKIRYREALASFQQLYDAFSPTEDDIFNLAQCYLLADTANGPQKAIEILETYISENPDSWRSYILLSIYADASGDSRASEYCRKAHNIYVGLSADESEKIDNDSLSRVKVLYKEYFSEEW